MLFISNFMTNEFCAMRISQEVAEIFWISTLFKLFFFVKAQDSCKKMVLSGCHQNKALSGHVIKTLNISTSSTETCTQKCYIEGNCTSYNKGPIGGKMRLCELNDADDVLDSGDVVSKNGYEFCTFKNPCSSSPRPANQVCQPDSSWNSFICSDGRWSAWSSWSSCGCDQSRTRQCVSPYTKQSATDCPGSNQEKRACVVRATNTTDGDTCVFPFYYDGKWYDHCTCADHDVPWCATVQIFWMGAWGDCPL